MARMRRQMWLLMATTLAALGAGCNHDLSSPSIGSETREIQLLYSEGCGNTERALAAVERFAKENQVQIAVQRVVISTEADVQEHRFLGSPTFRINGLDVDPAARSLTEYGFS